MVGPDLGQKYKNMNTMFNVAMNKSRVLFGFFRSLHPILVPLRRVPHPGG